jgi:Tol biopolymer transport system component
MMVPNGWSPDGHLSFMDFRRGPTQVATYSASSRETKGLTALGAEALFTAEAQFSPDGKWISYTANGSIFVQPFPGPGGRIQISSSGGAQSRWSHDGARIFYIQPDKKLMEAAFDSRKGSAGTPRALFQTRIVGANFVLFQYDVAPDGRFLINSLPASSSPPLTLVTGWTASLKGR